MSAIVNLGRILDGAILGVFVMIVSALALHAFGAFHQMVTITQRDRLGVFSMMMSRSFPFKGDKFEYNLMHILLFAVLTALMSMAHHRKPEREERDFEKQEKDKKAKEKSS